MLQLQHSYSLEDAERLFVSGCATDRYIAFSTGDGATHVLSSDAKLLYTLFDGQTCATALEITFTSSDPTDEVLITGHAPLIKVYNLKTGALRLDFQTVHKTPINALKAFQIPGNEMKAGRWTMLASADINGTIILWEMNTDGPKLLHTVTGQNRSITNLSMHPSDQKLLVSGSYDGSIRLLDVESGAQILTCELEDRDERMRSFTASNGRVHTFKEGVSSMVVTLDGTIISGGWSGFVRVWKASTSKLEKSWQAHFDGHPIVGPVLNKILLHPSGEAFITSGTDGRIRLWDLSTYECIREIKPFEHSTLPGTFAWYGNALLCAGKDGSPENVCGDFVRTITWDLTRLRLEDGVTENYTELVPACNIVRSLWVFGSHVVISAGRKGIAVIDVWSEQDETA